MIRITGLSKTFQKNVHAVRDVSFEINDNEVFALLGPNGAGKTTTMRIVSTLLSPTRGTVEYDGESIRGNEIRIRRMIGFLTNEIRLDGQFTPNELAEYYASLYGLEKKTAEANKKRLFDYFGISAFADRRYETFSTGMKQKTSIAICMLHDPQVIIFDEPTNGLDILTQQLIEDFILLEKERGKCVIISTHILEVVEKLADRVGVIIDGRSVFCGSCDEMMESVGASDLSSSFIEMYRINHHEEPIVSGQRK